MSPRPRILTLLVAACLGCAQQPAPPVPPPGETTVSAASNNHRQPAAQNPATTTAIEQPSASVSSRAAGDDPSAGAPSPPPLPPDLEFERLIVFAPGAPILIDLALRIDGQPYDTGMDRLIDSVRTAADTNGDRRATWQELAENEEFLFGPLANLTPETKRQARGWRRQYDLDGNSRINRAEARAWLGRDRGGSAQSLTLRSSRTYLYDPRTNSPVWQLLDIDSDGHLTPDELAGSARRLCSRDADDDQVVSLADFASPRDQVRAMGTAPMSDRTNRGRRAAILLSDQPDWYRVLYTLSDLYAAGRELGPASFPRLPGLFAELDLDGNGRLNEIELAQLKSHPAHVRLLGSFGTDSNTPTPSLRVIPQAGSLEATLSASPHRVVIALAGDRLVLTIHDLTQGAGEMPDNTMQPTPSVAGNQIRVLVHDRGDALFGLLDANHDGRLGEQEMASAVDRIGSVAADDQAGLLASELPAQTTVALTRGEVPAYESYEPLPLPLDSQETSIAPDWFVRGDFNRDGEISQREFLGTADQFAELDRDHNGFVSRNEALADSRPASR